MTDLHQVADIDLSQLSDFQKELHFPPKESKEDDEDNLVMSPFLHKFKKISWSTQLPEEMQRAEESDKCIFYANSKFHYLTSSYLVQPLPSIRVRAKFADKYQICWSHNLGHNITEHGRLLIDEDHAQRINTVWLDKYSQYYVNQKRKEYLESIGNLPFLTDWSTFLPEYNLYLPQPWFYSRRSKALPLFLCKISKVKHEYKLKRDLQDLLRMRRKDKNGIWKEIKCHPDIIEGAKDDKIPYPSMWGRYSLITPAEKNWREKSNYNIYIDDILSFQSPNTEKLGKIVEVPVSSYLPVRAFFCVAENMSAKKINNLSNYTTDMNDLSKGWCPIRTCGMNRGNIPRIAQMDHGHFDTLEPLNYFPMVPYDKGYLAHSLSYDTTSMNAEVGMTLDPNHQSKILLKLENTNPMLSTIKHQKSDAKREIDDIDDDDDNDDEKEDKTEREQVTNGNSSNSIDHPNGNNTVTGKKEKVKKDHDYQVNVTLLITRKLTFSVDKRVVISTGNNSNS